MSVRAVTHTVLYHWFPAPVPYRPALQLQQRIHELQLSHRRKTGQQLDVLLLLQHRPVYTGGRRQNGNELASEKERLEKLGAEWLLTARGGETTYHGPGQIVAYPLLDLGRMSLSVRDYICYLQRMMTHHAEEHGLKPQPNEHTGLFLSDREKLGSIGVQIRHRLTTHGLALNITQEPIMWFNEVVACGLEDVKAVSLSGASGKVVDVESQVEVLLRHFRSVFHVETAAISEKDAEISDLILSVERDASAAGAWALSPMVQNRE